MSLLKKKQKPFIATIWYKTHITELNKLNPLSIQSVCYIYKTNYQKFKLGPVWKIVAAQFNQHTKTEIKFRLHLREHTLTGFFVMLFLGKWHLGEALKLKLELNMEEHRAFFRDSNGRDSGSKKLPSNLVDRGCNGLTVSERDRFIFAVPSFRL